MSQWHGGKGDKDRTSDINKYRNNYDLIDWSKKDTPEKPVESTDDSDDQNPPEVFYGS
jgi:hypothetical protein